MQPSHKIRMSMTNTTKQCKGNSTLGHFLIKKTFSLCMFQLVSFCFNKLARRNLIALVWS